MMKFVTRISAILILLLFFKISINAGPTIIRDNRITDIGATPVLGRGYSISTNTFQSTCMKNVVMTEPSYDFVYTFKSLDEFENQVNTSTDPKVYTNTITSFIGNLRKEQSVTKDGTTTKTKNVTKKKQVIVVQVDLRSYYSSVDESQTKLSDSAAALVSKSDFPGFFRSCGAYYVRSLGRKAQYIAFFVKESKSTEEDEKFRYELESELKSFRKKVITRTTSRGWWWWRRRTTTREERWDQDRSESYSKDLGEQEDSFSKSAKETKLTITASAFGLGKNENATLISYDIDTFKAAIKDAFLAMQNPNTGKVVSIEVVPWVENTEFQNLSNLGADEFYTDDEGNKKVLRLYQKKTNLNENAEFLAQIERTDRQYFNLYYKAKVCRDNISQYKEGTGADAKFKKKYADRWVNNNRLSYEKKTLVELDEYITKAKVDSLLKAEKTFMYGGGKFGKGAAACIDQLMEKELIKVSYRDIKECQNISDQMATVEDETIDNYCMPVLSGKPKSKVEKQADGLRQDINNN